MKSKIIGLTSLAIISVMLLSACSGIAAFSQNGSAGVAQAASSTSTVVTTPNTTVAQAPVSSASSSNAAQTTSIASSDLLTAYQNTLESIYATINPQVVNISVLLPATSSSFQTFPFGSNNNQTQQYTSALGSGFFWDSNGDIVTNNHVVDGATDIQVTLSDGTTYPATIVGQDPYSDLAVIKAAVPADQIHPVTLADSTQVKVGDIAIAIGEPYGYEGSMSVGNISGLGRDLPTSQSSQSSQTTTTATYSIPDVIQTDASINPGNSGGVLVNINGQVMGVTSAIESNSGSSSGVGFAIPAEIVAKVVPELISSGSYQHPYLGISGTDMSPAIAQAMNLPDQTRGALVVTVTAGGPADNAGLQPSNTTVTINGVQGTVGGDIITAIDGQSINSMSDLIAYLAIHTEVGQQVSLTILRNGQTQTVNLTLGSRPTQ
jgi:serine protease Do